MIIFADDLGYGDLGSYGHPSFATPRIDRMAAQGVRFTDFYAPVPYCAPSRAALLTGRYPLRNGVVQNPAPDQGMDDVGLPDSEVTLAEALKTAGYATACIGKWHLGHKPQFYPTRQGFDHYYGILYSNDMRPVQLVEGAATSPELRVVEDPVVQATLTQRYTERALRFIENHKDKPFFLYLPHAMPHKPLAASEAFYKTTPSLYGDVMAELDRSVGQVLDKLKELGIEENTLVIFLSDNGPWYGGSSGGLRGMKGRVWEGGVRVPMIARMPGRIPAGRVQRTPAMNIDIFPTVLALAGLEPAPSQPPLDGKNLWPAMTRDDGPAAPTAELHEALFFMQGPKLAAVRSGPWKLHVINPGRESHHPPNRAWIDPRGPDGVTILAPYEQPTPADFPGVLGPQPRAMMLFNLESDPAEQHDLAAEQPQIVQRLKAIYDQMEAQATPVLQVKGHPLKAPGPRPSR